MGDSSDLDEINRRIAILRDNLRNLVEQAAGNSGAADEARISERIADMEGKLAELLKQRNELSQ
jgi:predicted  nucleic acid-binding Zn-ribbon protein